MKRQGGRGGLYNGLKEAMIANREHEKEKGGRRRRRKKKCEVLNMRLVGRFATPDVK